jgi:hypothetical protein
MEPTQGNGNGKMPGENTRILRAAIPGYFTERAADGDAALLLGVLRSGCARCETAAFRPDKRFEAHAMAQAELWGALPHISGGIRALRKAAHAFAGYRCDLFRVRCGAAGDMKRMMKEKPVTREYRRLKEPCPARGGAI